MKQHVIQDQVAVRYASGVDHVWESWEPSLRRCERMFGAGAWRAGIDGDELASQLRRAQYRAHASSEFAAGLVPPPSAATAHTFLMGALGSCRDVLGVLAIRAELDELNDDAIEIGLHAIDVTRDAFRGARSSAALVHAWLAEDQADPEWLDEPTKPSAAWPSLIIMLVLSSICLFVVLVMQIVSLSTGA